MNPQYKELSDKAFELHKKGDFSSAADIYQQLLSVDPDDANILNLSGMLLLGTGHPDEAVDYLTKAFILNPSSAVANNLAKAYYSIKQYEKAVKLYLEALKLPETDTADKTDDIYYSLGLAYKKTGRPDDAEKAYLNALEANPENYSACFNLSLLYGDKGSLEKAVFYAEKCAEMKPSDDTVQGILSGFYEKLKDYEKAEAALQKAILIKPSNFVYYYNAAVLNSLMNKDDKAVYLYLKAISLKPEHTESYVNLANIIKKQNSAKAAEYLLEAYKINPGEEKLMLNLAQIYKDMGKNAESLKILSELTEKNNKCAEAYSLAAMNYMDLCRYEAALKCYDRAVNLMPENLNFQHGRAVCLKYLDRIPECLEILEKLAADEKAGIETKITLGMLYLQNKEFEKGMQLYRLRLENIKSSKIKKESIWEPYDSIRNKTVLVYANCGLGDSIMYSRYLPMLKEQTNRVILQIDNELASIMQASFPMISVIKKTADVPAYDTALQFMDIQYALNLDFSFIPASNGYLKANDDLIGMFSKLPVFDTKKKKIGLFWQGNKRIFKNRAVPFGIIKQLAGCKDYNFYSFQIDARFEDSDNFFDLSKHIKDYSDTAALLKNMDMLITVDSSIAHMAGALGVKTYLLLPKTAEWRWFYDDKTTPWYDSITIFKQKTAADWQEVIDRVRKAL